MKSLNTRKALVAINVNYIASTSLPTSTDTVHLLNHRIAFITIYK